MKKIKTLALAVLPIATVSATVAMAVTSCSKDNGIRTMSYDEAKAWVKQTWGSDEGKQKLPTSATSSWKFNGEITTRKSMDEQYISTYQGYFKNHFANWIQRFGFMDDTKGNDIKATISMQEKSTTFSVESQSEFVNNVEFTSENWYKTLTEKNFDETMSYYFFGSTGKKYTKFIVDTNAKTMKATGLFYAIEYNDLDPSSEYAGYNILSLPDFSVSFGKEGQITGVEFKFEKYAEAEYIWYNLNRASYRDWFDFTLDEGGFIKVAYNYETK